MLELKDISLSLSYNGRPLIEHFSFTLNPGDKAVIIGEEGNGKSTLLKLIYDAESVEGYCAYSGKIIKKGRLAYLPQMLEEKYLEVPVRQYFEGAETYLYAGLLPRLGLSAEFIESDQRIGTLSGGEKIKVQLLRLLMEDPDVLLLDEPTNDIDIETLEWLEKFIVSSKLPILYVSHDEMLIENTANVIIHMEQLIRKTKCRITVTHSSYGEYVEARKLNFDKQLQVAKKQRSDYDAQMERWTQIYNRVDHEQRTISRQNPSGGRLLKKKMKAVKSQEKRLERQSEDFVEIPEAEDAILTKFSPGITLPKAKTVLDFSLNELKIGGRLLSRDIRLFVAGGEHIGIVGKNGAGKSTLLDKIWEELKDRRDITAAYMPQDYARKLDYGKTPIEFLAASYTKEEMTRARTYMGSMKFTHEEMTGKIGNLSGGQKAKILFLDMVLMGANVLILDEPTRNFSPLSSPVIRKTLSEFGGAIISISHDRKYLEEVCQKVYVLTGQGLAPQAKA